MGRPDAFTAALPQTPKQSCFWSRFSWRRNTNINSVQSCMTVFSKELLTIFPSLKTARRQNVRYHRCGVPLFQRSLCLTLRLCSLKLSGPSGLVRGVPISSATSCVDFTGGSVLARES